MVGWVGQWVGWLLAWSVGRSVGWVVVLVGWLVDSMVALFWLVGSVGLVDGMVTCYFHTPCDLRSLCGEPCCFSGELFMCATDNWVGRLLG